MTIQAFFQILNQIQACTCAIEEATKLSLQDSELIDHYRAHRAGLYSILLLKPSEIPVLRNLSAFGQKIESDETLDPDFVDPNHAHESLCVRGRDKR
jgi:hypothetical protein